MHALSSTFRLAQAPEQSTWLFLSLHRLPAFLLVATLSLLLFSSKEIFCTVVIGVPPRRHHIDDPERYHIGDPRLNGHGTDDASGRLRCLVTPDITSICSVLFSFYLFPRVLGHVDPLDRPLLDNGLCSTSLGLDFFQPATRPATSLFGLSSTRPATSFFGLSSTRPATSSTSVTAWRHFTVSPRWCPACNAHPSRDAARGSLSVLHFFLFVSLPQPLCFFFSFTVPCSLFISWVFFHTNSLEGEYCSVPPSHTTHKPYLQLLNFSNYTSEAPAPCDSVCKAQFFLSNPKFRAI